MNKIKIKELIVVEGRDDTCAIKNAVDAETIETHGFGIKRETWELIQKAYENNGIIIFTDPDYSGEEIRRKLMKKFPESKQAFLTQGQATKNKDIGIENAKPHDIVEALKKARFTEKKEEDLYNESDLEEYGLIGKKDSKEKREKLGEVLGIGYSNGKSLIKKLNAFNINKKEYAKVAKEL